MTNLNCFKKDESADDEALELTIAEVSNESQNEEESEISEAYSEF